MTTEARKLLEVELLCCPTCGLVGKIPLGRGSANFKGACTGPPGAEHKRTVMRRRVFREVREDA